MNETKKKIRFNLIDAIILLVIIAAVAFVAIKLSGGGLFGSDDSLYVVKYYCDEVPEFAAEVIYVGDKVVDEQKDTDLGEVTAVSLFPSRTYAETADGQYKLAPKEHFNAVEVVTIVKGTDYDNGVIIGMTMFYALLSVVAIILGDILMSLMDPRISFTTKAR